MARQPRPFRPSVEALPARDLPAASVTLTGSTLTVTGTPRGDTVQITELGLNEVQVQVSSKTPRVYEGVESIDVKTQGGKDRVSYSVQTVVINNRSVNVDLGTGNDMFQMTWSGTQLGSSTTISVNAGNGNDNVSVTANGAVAAGQTLGLTMYGGRGLDVMQFAYSGSLNGHLGALADGGRENDAVSVQVSASAGDSGTFQGRVFGAAGNDQLILAQTQATDPNLPWWQVNKLVTLDALLDGGTGADQASVSNGVTVLNVP